MTSKKAENSLNSILREETALADLYSFLSLLLQKPTQELYSGLGTGKVRDDLREIFLELQWDEKQTKEIVDMFTRVCSAIQRGEMVFSDIRSEYTRLFSHPKTPQVPLYEGAYLEKRAVTSKNVKRTGRELTKGQKELEIFETEPLLFINKAALDAERCYKKLGLVRLEKHNVPADSMATEMEFLHHLHLQMAVAVQEEDEKKSSKIQESYLEFKYIHLEKWMVNFFRDVYDLSTCDVYRATGLLGTRMTKWSLVESNYSKALKTKERTR